MSCTLRHAQTSRCVEASRGSGVRAETRTIQGILHGDRRFVIPVYQRPYVWQQDRQWEPLWDDLEATVVRLHEVRESASNKGEDPAKADAAAAPHFLGAIVIEQSPTKTGDIETRLVVDGQQRLTTLQLLLRGVLDALEAQAAPKPLQAKLRKAILNDEEVVDAVHLLKLAPRPAEQADFEVAMATTTPPAVSSRFAAARCFFAAATKDFLLSSAVAGQPQDGTAAVAHRADLLVSTLLNLMKLVVIDLEDVDDAQVIFEALNARNTPLSATDLVKNLLFLRAQAQHQNAQDLYDQFWKRFDDHREWWTEAVGIGHAQRARQDWLLGDWLIAERGRVISIGRLYGEFRSWLDESGTKPFDALATLGQYAHAYEMLHGRRPGASPREVNAFQRIESLNITVATPLLLWLLTRPGDELPKTDRERAFRAVESFIVRRMAVKYQTRAYAQAFADVLRAARRAASPADGVIQALKSKPQQYTWPADEEIRSAFATGRYYGPGGVNRDRLRLLLSAVDRQLQDEAHKTEQVNIDYGGLQIEHVIPQGWRQYWPLAVVDPAERAIAEQDRDTPINRIGNLTLATAPLNNSMSNDPWASKRAELSKHSVLRLNSLLIQHDHWDEAAIDARSEWLADRVNQAWPGPNMWDASE